MGDSDKRKFTRYACSVKTKFDYYVGNPDEIDINVSVPKKGKGVIIDISCGGVFIASDSRVPAGMPVVLFFTLDKKKMSVHGRIARTGLLQNNPSEVAKKFSMFSSKGDSYIAVEFNNPIDEFNCSKL